jgi:hypothetical protein
MEEVKAASLELLDEPDLEEEASFFIEEEAEPSEREPLDEFAETPRPPPSGLTYAFLNNNLEFPCDHVTSLKFTLKNHSHYKLFSKYI